MTPWYTFPCLSLGKHGRYYAIILLIVWLAINDQVLNAHLVVFNMCLEVRREINRNISNIARN